MKKLALQFISISIILIFTNANLYGQMISHVNSLADDADAHPYDDPSTLTIDESIDGKCGDYKGRCTFRAALEEADVLGLSAYVYFDVDSTIVLDPSNGTFNVPDHSVIIGKVGLTLWGWDTTSCIVLGVGNSVSVKGLQIAHALYGMTIGDDNFIGEQGGLNPQDFDLQNRIWNCAEAGILVSGNNNLIVNNSIGIDYLDGAGLASPCQFGIFVVGTGNQIGDSVYLNSFNQISGNDIGIAVRSGSAGVNSIIGNRIGTDYTADHAIPNRIGVEIQGSGIYVGGGTWAGANYISGNTESGILMGTTAHDNFILNNFIGVEGNQIDPLPNRDGITLGPGTYNCLIQDNVISNNTENGILISGIQSVLETYSNTIYGNTIRYNGHAGINLNGGAHDNVIGSSLTVNHPLNYIHDNGWGGVIMATGAVGTPEKNTVRKNKFANNNVMGIRIMAGQNNIPRPMILTAMARDLNFDTVGGTHTSIGATIDFYSAKRNQSGAEEGYDWLGKTTVDAGGVFSTLLPTCLCDTIVATATDVLGNTSEFSDGSQLTSVSDYEKDIAALRVFPNPFQENTTLTFSIPKAGDFVLKIYNAASQEVEKLFQGSLTAGTYTHTWHSEDYPAGVYYCSLISEGQQYVNRKLVHIK